MSSMTAGGRSSTCVTGIVSERSTVPRTHELLERLERACDWSGRLERMAAAMHWPPRADEVDRFREALLVWTLRLHTVPGEGARVLALGTGDAARLVERVRLRISADGIRLRHRGDRVAYEYALGGWRTYGEPSAGSDGGARQAPVGVPPSDEST